MISWPGNVQFIGFSSGDINWQTGNIYKCLAWQFYGYQRIFICQLPATTSNVIFLLQKGPVLLWFRYDYSHNPLYHTILCNIHFVWFVFWFCEFIYSVRMCVHPIVWNLGYHTEFKLFIALRCWWEDISVFWVVAEYIINNIVKSHIYSFLPRLF